MKWVGADVSRGTKSSLGLLASAKDGPPPVMPVLYLSSCTTRPNTAHVKDIILNANVQQARCLVMLHASLSPHYRHGGTGSVCTLRFRALRVLQCADLYCCCFSCMCGMCGPHTRLPLAELAVLLYKLLCDYIMFVNL